MKLKMKLRLLSLVFGNFITLFLLIFLPMFIVLFYYTYINTDKNNSTFVYLGLGLTLILYLFNMCHMSYGIGYKIFRRYIKYVCGKCRQYRVTELTKCLVKNTIYYGPSGCLERTEKTKTELCRDCLKDARKRKTLIKILEK